MASGACTAPIPGPGSTGAGEVDAGEAGSPLPDAAAGPIQCNGELCRAVIGGISVDGFSRAEVEHMLQLLTSLPTSLTQAAHLAIDRDSTDQSGCPDLARTPLLDWPAGCAYADPEELADGFALHLHDVLMITHPERVDHVLVTFLARMWALDRLDQTMIERHLHWTLSCHACPGDTAEPCAARDIPEGGYGRFSVMTDFTAAVAASYLGDHAWGNEGVRWIDGDGAACDPSPTQAWITSHIVHGEAMTSEVHAIDVLAACPEGATDPKYKITTSQTITVYVTSINAADSRIAYFPGGHLTNPPESPSRDVYMSDGVGRILLNADLPFEAASVGCQNL